MMDAKRKFIYVSFLLLFKAIQALETTNGFYNTKIIEGRYRRAINSATPKCRISQYFDKEEGRCLGVPGGGRVVSINYDQSCGTHSLKPHCSNTQYYYVCQGSYTILAQCARGQQFENRLQKCVSSRRRNSKPLFIHPEDEQLVHIQPPPCKQHGRFPIEGHCNLFYTCDSNGHYFHQDIYKCPQNGIYNAEQGMCIFSSTAESCLTNIPQTCVPLATTTPPSTESNESISTQPTDEQTEQSVDLSTTKEYPLEEWITTTLGYEEVTDTATEQSVLEESETTTSADDLDLEDSRNYPETTVWTTTNNEDTSTPAFSDSDMSQTTEMSLEVTAQTESDGDEDISSTTVQNLEDNVTPSQTESDVYSTTTNTMTEAVTEESVTDIPDMYSESTTNDFPTTTDVSTTDDFLITTEMSTTSIDIDVDEPIDESEEITTSPSFTPSIKIETTSEDTTKYYTDETSTPSSISDELNMDYSTPSNQYPDLEVTSQIPNNETSTDYEESELKSEDSVTEYPNSSTVEPEHYNNTDEKSESTLPSAEINESQTSPSSTERHPENLISLLNPSIANNPPAIENVKQSERISATNENNHPQTFVTKGKHLTTQATGSARTRLPITSAITNLTGVLEHSITKLFHGFSRRLME